MKNIPNKDFSLKLKTSDASTATTASLLTYALAIPPDRGFDFQTMRTRNRVAAVLEKPSTEIVLEDADYATAQECIKACRWGVNHPDLLIFAEQFGL